MENLDISPNFSHSQAGVLGQEMLDKLFSSKSLIPQHFSGSFSDPLVNTALEAIKVTPPATYVGGESLIFPNQSFLTSENTQPASDGTDPLTGNAGVSTEAILSKAIASATAELANFVHQPKSLDAMHLAFGENWQAQKAIGLVQSLATGEALPKIEIIPTAQLGANGAFAKETNTIYLAAEFLSKNAANLQAVAAVVLEEAGHFLDSQLNEADSPGDEGAIFAALVQGKEIAPGELSALKAEDDSGTLTLNGRTIQVEHASDDAGVFTVGDTGNVTIDFLADSGSYTGEVAIFSLQGMDGLARGSVAFIQEAARRALSNSKLGYVAISDQAEGARFTGELGESNKNAGDYRQVKTFAMNPNEKFATMLVPNGTIAEVLSNPAIEGNKRPLFSIAAANPTNAIQIGQLVAGSVDGGVFAFEDIRLDQKSDQDYNDIIFKIGGATGSATSLGQLIASGKDWQNTELGQKLRNFASQELSTAKDLGAVTGSQTLNGFVGNDAPINVYRFTLNTTSNVNITLSGLSADADLLLIQDVNGNGVLDKEAESGEIIKLSELEGTASETINKLLQAGTYFVQVEQYKGDTNYNLSLNITPFKPPTDTAPNTIPTARDLGTLSGTLPTISEYVGSADTIDYYKFNIGTQSDLDLELSNLSEDANVRLIRDANNNGVVDSGEVVDFSNAVGDDNEYIFAPDLAAGNYFIEVQQVNGEVTYDLLLNTTASTTPLDNAGNSLSKAKDLGNLNGTVTVNDSVNNRDKADFYNFAIAQNSAFNLTLTGLTADADVYLIQDTNNNNNIDGNDVIAKSTRISGDETITLNLAAGNYKVEVSGFQGNTNYTLTLSATPTAQPPAPITQPAGTTLQTAGAQASPTFTASGNVSDTTQNNFYKFTVNESGIFKADLTGLTGDADVRLIRDYNNNGEIDPVVDRNNNGYIDKDEVEIVAWEPNRNKDDESIRAFLDTGDYFLEVNSPKKATTNYNVATTFTPAATDPLEFKINLNFTPAAEQNLSIVHPNGKTLKETVQEAANYWSRVITYSTFNKPHNINVKIDASDLGKNTLANAGASELEEDLKGRNMSIAGESSINSNRPDFVSDVRFLYETMIHEFGHVLGFTSGATPKEIQAGEKPYSLSWGDRDLVDFSDPKNPRYKAETFAGIAYGELRGNKPPTALQLTRGAGEGSDYSHWWRKIFNDEAQVESGEAGKPSLFSTISVGSTRDLGYNVNYGAAESYTLEEEPA